MRPALIELAQCAGNQGEDCRLPSDVPQAIGVTAVLLWLAVVAGVLLLALFLLRAKLERRRARRARRPRAPSTEIELR